jgi:hypothetical protein
MQATRTKSFSIGQLYIHLLSDTRFYLDQIRESINHNNYIEEEPVPFAKSLLANNDFPDEKIVGDPSNELIPQPESKEQLQREFELLKIEIHKVVTAVLSTSFKGKSKHPGFNYLNAEQWLQLAEMHFRHHLRQKKRIEEFLSENQELGACGK